MRILSEKTVVPIGFVLVFLGGCFWLSRVWFTVEASAEVTKKLSAEQREHIEALQKIDRRLSRIEGQLGVHGE